MGYSLRIGEAEIDYDEDCVQIDCATVSLPEAPAYGEPTDRMNMRWPSYTVWHNAMDTLGLTEIMYGKDKYRSFQHGDKHLSALIAEHPGATPITRHHLEAVEEVMAAYKARHPDHRAEYPPPKPDAKRIHPDIDEYRDEDLVDDPRYDAALCRGEWLLFWMRWAVKNCKQPVFVNS